MPFFNGQNANVLYDSVKSQIAEPKTKTLIFVPLVCNNAFADASSVEPVVSISSTKSTCLCFNFTATGVISKMPDTLSHRSILDFVV